MRNRTLLFDSSKRNTFCLPSIFIKSRNSGIGKIDTVPNIDYEYSKSANNKHRQRKDRKPDLPDEVQKKLKTDYSENSELAYVHQMKMLLQLERPITSKTKLLRANG